MKRLVYVSALASLFLFSCSNGGSEKINKITGKWTLKSFVNKAGENKTTACDSKTVWNFTQVDASPLSDGTEVMQLTATAPDNCKWYGFDAGWTIKDGKIFISTTNVGGMGGNSSAGIFEIIRLADSEMTLKIMGNQYDFVK
ncbi:MAG: lipocalin family protein [Lishizhenia sp.]